MGSLWAAPSIEILVGMDVALHRASSGRRRRCGSGCRPFETGPLLRVEEDEEEVVEVVVDVVGGGGSWLWPWPWP